MVKDNLQWRIMITMENIIYTLYHFSLEFAVPLQKTCLWDFQVNLKHIQENLKDIFNKALSNETVVGWKQCHKEVLTWWISWSNLARAILPNFQKFECGCFQDFKNFEKESSLKISPLYISLFIYTMEVYLSQSIVSQLWLQHFQNVSCIL